MERIIKETASFIPKERGSLPRVLLLDCDNKVFQAIEESGFQVFQGKSGFFDMKRGIPRDSSEIEIIFWDVSKMELLYTRFYFKEDYYGRTKDDKLKLSGKELREFFKQVMDKGGFIAIFFGKNYPHTKAISYCLNLLRGDYKGFSVKPRYSHQVRFFSRKVKKDLFPRFFKRFIKDENLRFSIQWHSNYEGLRSYFIDEDENMYAVVYSNKILISPKIDNLDEAILFLLRDVLPYICKVEIYPLLHQYKWLKDEFFKFTEIKKIEREIERIEEEYKKEIQNKLSELQDKKEELYYLYDILYKDDSDSFPKGEKLKDVVKKVLEKDIGFQNVRDMDEERAVKGLALKEDLRIGKEAFIEVKGTETGAKANWEKDLRKHIDQYCTLTKTEPWSIKKMLIFNHERRKDPRKRTKPFSNNPELLKSCETEEILLIPVFELFKIAIDLRNNKISQEDAQEKILSSKGLFIY